MLIANQFKKCYFGCKVNEYYDHENAYYVSDESVL